MPPKPIRRRTLAACIVALWTGVSLASCGSDPYHLDWGQGLDTVALYSVLDPTLGLYDGFDFVNGRPVEIEAIGSTGSWDVAVGGDPGGLVLMPPGAFGLSSKAGVAVMPGKRLEDVLRAPSDSASYDTTEPVPLAVGTTYVIRTRTATDIYGTTACTYYAKMEPLSVDPAQGRIRFIFGSNPNCYDLSLSP
jgi:hypothetical protein